MFRDRFQRDAATAYAARHARIKRGRAEFQAARTGLQRLRDQRDDQDEHRGKEEKKETDP